MTVNEMAAYLAEYHCGVAWNSRYEEFWPIDEYDGDFLEYWHDPEGCNDKLFEACLRKTYINMQRWNSNDK